MGGAQRVRCGGAGRSWLVGSPCRPVGPEMSYMLPHLHNGWQVDQAILSEEDRVVVIRFGHDWDPTCMKMDEVLYSIAEKVTQPCPAPPRGGFARFVVLDCFCLKCTLYSFFACNTFVHQRQEARFTDSLILDVRLCSLK